MRSLCALLMTVTALFVFGGCRELLKKEPPPPQETQGPKTKEEVLVQIRPIIAPIRDTILGANTVVSETDRHLIMLGLQGAIVQYGNTDYGKEALRELGYEVQGMAKDASSSERYQLVLLCVDIVELLSMESQLLERLGAKADVMLDKPQVVVKGFVDDVEKGQLYTFLEIINRRTGAVERLEAREGDEFGNLKLVRILGRNKAVIFEYLKVPGLFFEVESFVE
jgi:hypothetical protein